MQNYVKPNCSVKTGSWRSKKPVVDTDKCVGCKTCERVCPDMAIKVIDGKAVVDYDYCKGCGICANECPMKCIEMKPEKSKDD